MSPRKNDVSPKFIAAYLCHVLEKKKIAYLL
jgi:hypothetical protein